jgi:uncharacterized protein YjbJ (UPF0337 family)
MYEFHPITGLLYRIEGSFEELSADLMDIWGALTHEDMAEIEAKHNRLVARLKMRYGISTKEAEDQIRRNLGRERRQEPQAPA